MKLHLSRFHVKTWLMTISTVFAMLISFTGLAQNLPNAQLTSFERNQMTGTHTGISKIELTIRNGDFEFWNGTSFSPTYERVDASMSGDEWSYSFFPLLPGGSYYTSVVAFDNQGIPVYPFHRGSMTVDSIPPVSEITAASARSISGTASDNDAVKHVHIAIRQTGQQPMHWNGAELAIGFKALATELASDGTWSYTGPSLPRGTYIATSYAIDTTGLTEALPVEPYTFEVAPLSDVYDCGENGIDGDGCAEWVGPTHLTAGKLEDWRIRVETGASGIPAGGGIALGFHHASSWWVQTTNAQERHYVSAPSAFTLRWVHHAPSGMFDHDHSIYDADFKYHRILIATATEAIQPATQVEFHFGANSKKILTQVFADEHNEIRVSTDVNGDGKFKGITMGSPKVSIKPTAASEISAVVPSQTVINTNFNVHIRVEDKHHNLVHNYSGLADLTDEHGFTVATNVQILNGLGLTSVQLATAGPHRLRIHTTDSQLFGRSNPTRVFSITPTRKIYWGDLHGHTAESDGLGTDANEYFEFGCDIAALDFIALTDHGIPNWPANIQAVKDHHESGECVTLLATEANSRRNPQDHNNLYFRADDADPLPGWSADYATYLNDVHTHYNLDSNEALTGPHHSGYDRFGAGDPQYPFGIWNDRSARFFEVYSSHGASEFQGNPRPLAYEALDSSKYMQGGLAAGRKFAVIGSSDNHDTKPGRSAWGRYKGGLAAIWASDLTRNSVFDALWNYSTYGTSADRIYVDFNINSEPMGSTITVNGSNLIEFYVIAKTDIAQATLVRNGVDIKSWSTENGVIDVSHIDSTPGQYYYLRVSQDNGEQAWSTPVWTE